MGSSFISYPGYRESDRGPSRGAPSDSKEGEETIAVLGDS